MRQQLKTRIRNGPLWPAIQAMRARRFERAYRRRRDHYRLLLERQGRSYDEQKTIDEVRQRLQDRGYQPTRRSLGQVRTLSVISEKSWHPTLLSSLRELGPLHNCDPLQFGRASRRPADVGALRNAVHDQLLNLLAEQQAREPFDWVFVYGGGRVVAPETLRAIQARFGLPTVNLCLDDKNGWSGAVIDGVDTNQIDIAGAYDLVWSSASVACNWYLAEGGRPIYMPEGCDPTEYYPRSNHYDIDLSFMGACYGARPVVVRHLRRHGVPVTVHGRDWRGVGRFEGSPADLFSRSQINFGIGGIAFSEQLTNVKGRDFDVPCTGGGLYLTAFNPDLAQAFDVGREIVCYRNLEEAVELAHHYRARPDECRAIAAAARRRCLAEHTWRHRYRRLLSILGVVDDASSPAALTGAAS